MGQWGYGARVMHSGPLDSMSAKWREKCIQTLKCKPLQKEENEGKVKV